VGRKLLFSRQKLHQWIAMGGDLAGTMVGNESSSLEQMLNSGQARVGPGRINVYIFGKRDLLIFQV